MFKFICLLLIIAVVFIDLYMATPANTRFDEILSLAKNDTDDTVKHFKRHGFCMSNS